jgi:hypothetical protein
MLSSSKFCPPLWRFFADAKGENSILAERGRETVQDSTIKLFL